MAASDGSYLLTLHAKGFTVRAMKLAPAICCVLALVGGCGKAATKKSETKSEPTATPAAGAVAKPAALAAKPLLDLPLQADMGAGWKMDAQKVDPGGGVELTTQTGDCMIVRDGVNGIKKTTLEETRENMAKESPPAVDVREEKLADGWVLAYKVPGILPQHAFVVRTIAGQAYRCVITTEQPDEQQAAIDVCKSLRPSA